MSERRHYALWLAIGSVLAGVLLFAAKWEADRQERVHMDSFRGDIADLARMSEAIIADEFRMYDKTLLVLRDAYVADPKRFTENIKLLRSGPLADRELVLVLADREGYLAYTDSPNVKSHPYLGDRAYFRFFADGGTDRFYIDEPALGRVTRRYIVPLVRPIYDKQGGFLGVIAISIKQESLAHFGRLPLSNDTTVTITNQGGAFVSRSLDLAKVRGTKLPPELLAQMLRDNAGVFSGRSAFDGVEQIIAYRHIEGLPLIVYVTSSPGEVLRVTSLQRKVLLSGAGFTSLVILVLLMVNLQRQRITAQFIATQREHLQEAQRTAGKSEARLRTLVQTIPDLIWLKDPDGAYLSCNMMFERFFGAREADIVGKTDYDFVDRELADFFREHDRKAMAAGRPSSNEEWITFADDGHRALLDTIKTPMYDAEGKLIGVLGIARDITERRKAEEKLRESEERFKNIFDSATDGILIVDLETNKFIMGNRMICGMLGYDEEEIKKLSVRDIHPAKDLHYVIKQFKKHAKDEIQAAKDIPVIRKDGSVFYADINSSHLTLGGKTYLMGMFRDTTERHKLEDQLRQAQKMEGIGQLAGGIAHDFNNILSAIIGYGHIALMKMAKDDPQRINIEYILEAGNRAAQLTRELLLFSRKQMSEQKPVDLNKIIRKVEKFLKRVIGEDVECRASLFEEAVPVLGDAHQLEQVLVNLATNARDAMPAGGIFTVKTELVQLDREFISVHGYGKPGKYVLTTVSDTGKGMDEVTRQHIFEPFFTTKEVGKGTGLGLAVVYGIIKQHEGFIDVYSGPGEGTTFKIYLPLIASGEDEEKKEIQERPARGTETVLFAEDDEAVRNVTKTLLEDSGYTVITAHDGQDAVNKYKEHKDKIQLLLFDIVMPGKTGKEAYDEIRAVRPDIKIIFQSGYTTDIVREKVSLGNDVNIIYKPTPPMSLLKKVRSVLDEGKK